MTSATAPADGTARLEHLEIVSLQPHPDNPRLELRDDVIEQITAQVVAAGSFGQEHAILTRPYNGGYQIVAGHHRHAAALKAGLDAIPCWIREMDDDEAFMALVLSNSQGELTPLEIGNHAWTWVTMGKPGQGRGNTGGLSEYARKIGRDQGYLSRLRSAAKVMHSLEKNHVLTHGFLQDKAMHLYEISRAPRVVWELLAERLAKGYSVEKLAELVNSIKAFEIPSEYDYWLPLDDVVVSFLKDGKPTAAGVRKLIADAHQVFAYLAAQADCNVENEDLAEEQVLAWVEQDEAEFDDWLKTSDQAWSRVAIGKQLEGFVRRWGERRRKAEPKAVIAQEGWETWLPAQEQCDLLLTDPPYSTDVADVAEFARSWLPVALAKVKPTGRAYVCIGAYPIELEAYLAVPVPDHLTLEQKLVWTYRNTIGPKPTHTYWLNYQEILYFQGVDAPPLNETEIMAQAAVIDMNAPDGRRPGERSYTWQKPDGLAERLIRHATQPGDLVLDPFAGSGTFPLAAVRLHRRGLGCEVDPEVVQIAVERGCERQGQGDA